MTMASNENILGTNSHVTVRKLTMSDVADSNTRKETKLFEHWCEHLDFKKWASFGFAAGKAEPRWFCMEHRPEWGPKHA